MAIEFTVYVYVKAKDHHNDLEDRRYSATATFTEEQMKSFPLWMAEVGKSAAKSYKEEIAIEHSANRR